ncbi:RTA1 like protein-domain-containing protein [Microdochium trichocladiopsis]|uniref:RTA1 like protein-domain-containing protein n=1 Tax=Microdochium trichocladiopsis TaxID=1682393 RepID=A0A9P9BXZ9_9PEZI|nr:RTA1 like protein-domain-containing protein [Microdochium trichocladiopsis]KAH7037558.1 RTA1 like protein-domain-containing protein [Microdochium trichocladiopsis]
MAEDSNIFHGFRYYYFEPSLPAAATFLALFAITTAAHALQLYRHRTWYFIPFLVGGICETVGYGARIASCLQTPKWTLIPYIIQNILLLIAPALFAASVYMILGRLIRLVDGARYSVIPLKWLTKIFVTVDIIAFLLQGGGGGILGVAKDLQAMHTGESVIIAGLFVQLVGFSVFIAVAGLFHRRISLQPTPASSTTTLARRVPWQRYLVVLYLVSTLILVRSVFRAIEYIQGFGGYLQSTELFLYVFDAALMLLAMGLLNVWHPSSSTVSSSGRKVGTNIEFS